MERGLCAGALLHRPVVFRDIRLGAVVEVIFDRDVTRILGLDVLCGDRNRRFLSLAACEVERSVIRVDSALVLVAEELDFYRNRGRALTSLPNRQTLAVAHDGRVISRDLLRPAV
jgi:hypothetical protein